jgi:hypothetical protein
VKAFGDALGGAGGYTSQYGYELYDTSGTTEDDSYAATGGFGFTVEMGPPDGNFHMPYETGVVAEWTGSNPHSANRGGLREALLIATAAAANNTDHAILQGKAPAGKVLRVRKSFGTQTSAYCQKGIEPIVNIGLPRLCLTGEKPPMTIADSFDARTTVPASGAYSWHIGPSTRPFAGAAGQKEAFTLTCEGPGGDVLETLTLVIDRGQAATVNIGCGSGPTTFANGVAVGGSPNAPANAAPTPSLNGLTIPPAPVTGSSVKAKKPKTRAQKLAACNKKAKRIKSAKKRKAALKSCKRRYGKKPAAKKK